MVVTNDSAPSYVHRPARDRQRVQDGRRRGPLGQQLRVRGPASGAGRAGRLIDPDAAPCALVVNRASEHGQ